MWGGILGVVELKEHVYVDTRMNRKYAERFMYVMWVSNTIWTCELIECKYGHNFPPSQENVNGIMEK